MNKAIAILVIVTALIGLLSGLVVDYGNGRFQAGIDHQKAKQQESDDESESQALSDLMAKNKAIEEEKNKWKEKAERLSKVEPEVIYEEVTKIVEVESCTDRGADFVRLWNERHERFLLGESIISE